MSTESAAQTATIIPTALLDSLIATRKRKGYTEEDSVAAIADACDSAGSVDNLVAALDYLGFGNGERVETFAGLVFQRKAENPGLVFSSEVPVEVMEQAHEVPSDEVADRIERAAANPAADLNADRRRATMSRFRSRIISTRIRNGLAGKGSR